MTRKEITRGLIALVMLGVVLVFGIAVFNATKPQPQTQEQTQEHTLNDPTKAPAGVPVDSNGVPVATPAPPPAKSSTFNPSAIAVHLDKLSRAAKAENVAAAHKQCRILQTISEEQREALSGSEGAVWRDVMDDLWWAADACLENDWAQMGRYLDSVTIGTEAITEARSAS